MTRITLLILAAVVLAGCGEAKEEATLSTEDRVEVLEQSHDLLNKRVSEYFHTAMEHDTEEIVQLQVAVGALMQAQQQTGVGELAKLKEPSWPLMGFHAPSGLWSSGAIPPESAMPDGTVLEVTISTRVVPLKKWIRKDGKWEPQQPTGVPTP
jgi:hypothetical protein